MVVTAVRRCVMPGALRMRYVFCCKWNLPVVCGSCVALKPNETR
jgi:hypothetical protein